MSVIKSVRGKCQYCLACIRACPVKALKSVDETYFDVIVERCISCGLCVSACTQDALVYEEDIQKTKELLSQRKTVLVLTTEYVASFYSYRPEVVIAAFENAGFFAVEDSTLAEEYIAKEFIEIIRKNPENTYIRSTCPVVVEYFEKYHPNLLDFLAPVVSPVIAAGRIYKELYGYDIAVVYVSPCISYKSERKRQDGRDAVDAVLTLREAKKLLRDLGIDLERTSPSAAEGMKPALARVYSVRGGFPRQILSEYTHVDKNIKVVRGFEELEELVCDMEKGVVKPRIVDTLFCSSCIESPELDTPLTLFARKRIVEEYYNERIKSKSRVLFDQIFPRIPYINVRRSFRKFATEKRFPNEDEIRKILEQGERTTPEAILDCGACGYETCFEHAVAIFHGYSNWSRCVPFQRKVFARIVNHLKEVSSTDGLTGLLNHKTFMERLDQEFRRASRYKSPLSVLMLDLDGFKEINDTYGHIKGDEVLREVGEILKASVRAADIVARYGGDEFSIILPETTKQEAYAVAEKLHRAIREKVFELNGKEIRLSISTGISTLSDAHYNYFDMIEEADRAMYMAKQRGRNRIEHGLTGTATKEAETEDMDEVDLIESIFKEYKEEGN